VVDTFEDFQFDGVPAHDDCEKFTLLRYENSGAQKCFRVQIYVDNGVNTPQYLGVASAAMLQVGLHSMKLGPVVEHARENRSRRKLHARKEKGSEEEKETLETVSET
jgi:hypothetical protein